MKYLKRKLFEKKFLETNLVYEANLTLISTVIEILSHLSHLRSRDNNIPNVEVVESIK